MVPTAHWPVPTRRLAASEIGIVFMLFLVGRCCRDWQSDLVNAPSEKYPRRLLEIMDTLTKQQYLDKVILLDHHRHRTAHGLSTGLWVSSSCSVPRQQRSSGRDFTIRGAPISLIKLAGTANNPDWLRLRLPQNRYSGIDYVLQIEPKMIIAAIYLFRILFPMVVSCAR